MNNDTTITSNLTIYGSNTVKNSNILSLLNVSGNSILQGNTTIISSLNLNNSLITLGSSTFNSSLSINGITQLYERLNLVNLTQTSINSLNNPVLGNIVFNTTTNKINYYANNTWYEIGNTNNLFLLGIATICSVLYVSGNTVLQNTVSTNTILNNNITVYNTLNVSGTTILGSTTITSGINIYGNTILQNTSILSSLNISGSTNIIGNLIISGNSFINNSLNILNQKLYVDISGNTNLMGSLNINNNILMDIQGNMNINNNIINDNLNNIKLGKYQNNIYGVSWNINMQ